MTFDFEKPSDFGFRMPAEWEPQEAVWLSWPLNPETWVENISAVEREYAFFAAQISRFEKVRINCVGAQQSRVWAILSDAGIVEENLEFFDIATNDAWCRDHGPVFLKNDSSGEIALCDWKYNAWAGNSRRGIWITRFRRKLKKCLNCVVLPFHFSGRAAV